MASIKVPAVFGKPTARMSRNLVVRLLAESAGVREKNAGGMCSPELVALSPDDQVVEAV